MRLEDLDKLRDPIENLIGKKLGYSMMLAL